MKTVICTIATTIALVGTALPAKATQTEFLANQYCQTTTNGQNARIVNAALGDVVSILVDANKRKAWIERDREGKRTYQEFQLKFIKRSGSTSHWNIVGVDYNGGNVIRSNQGLSLTYMAGNTPVTSSCLY